MHVFKQDNFMLPIFWDVTIFQGINPTSCNTFKHYDVVVQLARPLLPPPVSLFVTIGKSPPLLLW